MSLRQRPVNGRGGPFPWLEDMRLLLGRPEWPVDLADVQHELTGRTVLVTGAAGSIGSGISRSLAQWKLERLVLVDQAESPLYRLEQELLETTATSLDVVLADVREEARVTAIMRQAAPHVVFHAAAYKHVPMLESHPVVAIRNNVGATLVVAEAARAVAVERFVLISTDKAIRPSSVMGASKRVAEQVLDSFAGEPCRTRLITVRFGNVLDSTGNVVEQFARQIANGGPVTVTHPGMTRYFMTRDEAVGLVLQASIAGTGGDVFLLQIDGPQRIVELAQRMIGLAAPALGREITVTVTAPRPGEKIHEDYYGAEPHLQPTAWPHVLRASRQVVDPARIRADVRLLLDLAHGGRESEMLAVLRRLVPDYRPRVPEPADGCPGACACRQPGPPPV
jgi:FlaA1/EpsC-like NDP-sugar epimerase